MLGKLRTQNYNNNNIIQTQFYLMLNKYLFLIIVNSIKKVRNNCQTHKERKKEEREKITYKTNYKGHYDIRFTLSIDDFEYF